VGVAVRGTAQRLDGLRYRVDGTAHIIVETSLCQACPSRPCLTVCPAGCFEQNGGTMSFSYQTCIECGSCRAICPCGAVRWNHPRGGFGVAYRLT